MIRGGLSAAIFAVFLCGLAGNAAAAASAICARLEARLSAVEGGGARDTARAIREQRAALRSARAEAHRADCRSGFLFFKSRGDAGCDALLDRIRGMEANLRRLEASSANGGSERGERGGLLRALAENDCGPQYARYAPRDRFGLFSRRGYYNSQGIWVPGDRSGDPWDDYREDEPSTPSGSGYRTVCVRTCDGFYFPISYSTSSSNFANDEATCRARCPGTDVALYAYRSGSDDVGSAVTPTGARYSDLPQAFAYRSRYNPSCGCQSAAGAPMTAMAGGYDAAALAAMLAPGTPPVPARKPMPGADPETQADLDGEFDPRDAVPPPPAETPVASLASETKDPETVRRVGPSYYYAQ
ncbi:DUF2865 domain-containing protein [Prosthecomicrobium pneumaticum]|uniref:DUF2865 domain-containing protein n=1 Tax=Prosthecomicrobium pneumaticum TaxID=81895 RepID=A0A7W9CSV4_9HYPH|nr:DUF2865 domain-containing protein [Prosthecomicrobium pneumaticum]MBB5751081.1 hypothetical protein [Prosthecomicrobium pneumaticum]